MQIACRPPAVPPPLVEEHHGGHDFEGYFDFDHPADWDEEPVIPEEWWHFIEPDG
jgi:hypothetical protein